MSSKILLDKIKDEVAREERCTGWKHLSHKYSGSIDAYYWPIVCERYASEKAKEKQTELRNHLNDGDLRFAIDETTKSLFQKEVYNELSIEQKVRAAELTIVLIDELRQSDKQDMFTRSEVESCIKDSLEAAAENLKFTLFPGGEPFVYPHVISHSDLGRQVVVDKSSITDTKNSKIK